MNSLKEKLYRILGDNLAGKLNYSYTFCNKWRLLMINSFYDAKMYHKYSSMVNKDDFRAIEATIILHYHAIEKAFLHEDFRYRFGIPRIKILIKLLKSLSTQEFENSQIQIACDCLCKYYEKHIDNEISLDDFFKHEDYLFFMSKIKVQEEIVIVSKKAEFFDPDMNFKDFSFSRRSVRNFSGKYVSNDVLEKVIDIARTSPSVCNRQPAKVYCVQNKAILKDIFKLQGGLQGFTDGIVQVLVLTSDRRSFYSVGERNQLFIDGGLFLMNLLYALHYYKIGACPAHWAKEKQDDISIRSLLNLSASEKVICIVPIGIPKEEFKITLSKRRNPGEVLTIVN